MNEDQNIIQVGESLPSWERGLKFGTGLILAGTGASLPSWERGLK